MFNEEAPESASETTEGVLVDFVGCFGIEGTEAIAGRRLPTFLLSCFRFGGVISDKAYRACPLGGLLEATILWETPLLLLTCVSSWQNFRLITCIRVGNNKMVFFHSK